MSSDVYQFIGNIYGHDKPLRVDLPVAAGSTTTIDKGEMCELDTGVFTPISADDSFAGVLAICDEEITAERKVGRASFIVPRPGDLFRVKLAAETNPSRGASLYYSTSKVVATSGSNPFANVFNHAGFPQKQGRADVGDVADRGTAIGSVLWVEATIKAAASYYAALQL